MAICKGTLKTGNACANRAKPYSEFCGVHKNQIKINEWRNSDGLLHREGDLPAVSTKLSQKWYINGLLHRDNDKAAVITTHGDTIKYEWYVNGKLHRENDRPAIVLKEKKRTMEAHYYVNGVLHREDDLPAIQQIGHMFNDDCIFFSKIDVLKESYYKHGVLHRDGDKPAYHVHNNKHIHNGGISFVEHYYKYGMKHRAYDRPAIIERDFNGKATDKEYYLNDMLHREKGMAFGYLGYFFEGKYTTNLITAMKKFWIKNNKNQLLVRFVKKCALKWRLKIAIEWRPPHGVQYVKMMDEYSDEL